MRACACVRERERQTERVVRALMGLGWFWKAVGNCRINGSYLTAVYFYRLFTDGSVMTGSDINFYSRLFNCRLFARRAQHLTRYWIDLNVRRFGIMVPQYPKEGISQTVL